MAALLWKCDNGFITKSPTTEISKANCGNENLRGKLAVKNWPNDTSHNLL